MISLYLKLLVAISSILLVCGDALPTCQIEDFHWEYTECDGDGGRWKVQVPKPGKCTGGAPRPPERGTSCDFTCKPGEYLDVQGDQQCKLCPRGTFSLGGGVRFEDWDTLPMGFTSKAEPFSMGYYTSRLFGGSLDDKKSSENSDNEKSNYTEICEKSGWVPSSKFISMMPGPCITSLAYTVNLVKPGQLKFQYQYRDESSRFHVQISNSKCQSYADSSPYNWLQPTKDTEWTTKIIPLKSGPNTISFETLGLSTNINAIKEPIKIKFIDITGIAFTQECTKCRSGTYSDKEGSTYCDECPENKYSEKGAGECLGCQANEYSVSGSSNCTKKPQCTDKDYFEYHTECDKNNQTQVKYMWLSPKRCLDGNEIQGAAVLPPVGTPESCPPCNPGMGLVNGTCAFCPSNQYSNGVTGCQPCPENTAPNYGISLQWWNNLPADSNISSRCLAFSDSGCISKNGWLVSTDSIHTSKGHSDDAFMVLSLMVGGFKAQNHGRGARKNAVASITFLFDLKCEGKCTFFFMRQDDDSDKTLDDIDILQTWTGPTTKQQYTYDIHSTDAVTFSWAFQKNSPDSGDSNKHLYADDIATIYAVNVTNTVYGGAVECTTCPQGTNKEGCIPCPAGHYVDPVTSHCVNCPPGTVVHSSNPWGKESCKSCGQGLTVVMDPKPGKADCQTSCKYSADGKNFDFTPLAGEIHVEGTRLFTSTGSQYYHYFNISLCGGSLEFPLANCYDNISNVAASWSNDSSSSPPSKKGEVNTVSSSICRSTIIPPKPGSKDEAISAQPSSIGDVLVNISTDLSFINAQMQQEGFKLAETDDSDSHTDIHFYYIADSSTTACKSGRSTIITLRCDISAKGVGQLELPPKCSDGTCDGCNFHFLWRTVHACPVCDENSYKEVRGECIKGEQEIHLIGPSYCPEKTSTLKQTCSILPFWLQVSIALVCALGLFLFFLVIYCWKHNKKLEYKYMKLVAGSDGGKDGEMNLPAAETCALSDDDEDEHFDAVDFKETKGNQFFSKLKNMGKKDDTVFEASAEKSALMG